MFSRLLFSHWKTNVVKRDWNGSAIVASLSSSRPRFRRQCPCRGFGFHPNNTANFDSVGEKRLILNSLGFGGTWYIYIMASGQLDSLNSSIKIQSMNLDLMFNLFHKTSLRCHWLLIFCQLVKNFFRHGWRYTMVKGWWSHPPVTAIGTTTPTLVERGWRCKTMITCTTCYRCIILWQTERLYCFFVWSACCYTNILYRKACTVPAGLTAFFKSIEHLHSANCFVQIDNFDLIWIWILKDAQFHC